MDADFVVAPYVALICTVVLVLTAEAFPVNVIEFDPPGTVTVDGTTRLALLLVTPTATPLEGAVELRVTVQLVDPAPDSVVGVQDREFS